MKYKDAFSILFLMYAVSTAQWQKCNVPYSGSATINAIDIGNNMVFIGGSKGPYYSNTNGNSWSLLDFPGVHGIVTDFIILAIFVDGPIILISTFAWQYEYTIGNIYLSKDSGKTWNVQDGIAGGTTAQCYFKRGNTIFAGCDGMGRSFDSGSTWATCRTGLPSMYSCIAGSACFQRYSTIPAIAANDSFMFAGTRDRIYNGDTWAGAYVYRSADSATSWIKVRHSLTDPNIQCLAVNGSNLFAGTLSKGVFLTTDNGNNWSPVNSGLTNLNIRALLAVGSHLFAGTKGGGVFHSADSGKRWIPCNRGLTDSTIAPLAADSLYIYAGSDSAGGHVWRLPLAGIAAKEENQIPARQFSIKILSPGQAASAISIAFSLLHPDHIQLSIYSPSGHLIAKLLDKAMNAGQHSVQWDTRGVGAGCYIVKLQAGGTVETRVAPVFR